MAYFIEKRPGKSGTNYRVQVRIQEAGKVVQRESKTFTDYREAVAWGTARDKKLQKALGDPEVFLELTQPVRRPVADVLSPTMGELVDRYLETYCGNRSASVKSDLKAVKASKLASIPLRQITQDDIVDYIKENAKRGNSPATCNNLLVRISMIFKAALGPWKLRDVPFGELAAAKEDLRFRRLISASNKRTRMPSDAEIERLIAHFEAQRDREVETGYATRYPMSEIIRFAVASGRRIGEVTQLRWADCDPDKKSGIVPVMKDGRNGQRFNEPFQFTDEAWEIAMRQPKTDERIFPYNKGTISQYFSRAKSALGIKNLVLHDSRRRAITDLIKAGNTLPEVALVSRHKSWESLRRYAELQPGDVTLKKLAK